MSVSASSAVRIKLAHYNHAIEKKYYSVFGKNIRHVVSYMLSIIEFALLLNLHCMWDGSGHPRLWYHITYVNARYIRIYS